MHLDMGQEGQARWHFKQGTRFQWGHAPRKTPTHKAGGFGHMFPETKGTRAHLLRWRKSRCGSELAAGCHRVSLLAPGWKERGHGRSPVHHQEPRRADTTRPTGDAPA